MLLSAVYVLVVAQSSSENPEGLMNNPVYASRDYKFTSHIRFSNTWLYLVLAQFCKYFDKVERTFEILVKSIMKSREKASENSIRNLLPMWTQGYLSSKVSRSVPKTGGNILSLIVKSEDLIRRIDTYYLDIGEISPTRCNMQNARSTTQNNKTEITYNSTTIELLYYWQI